MKLPFGIIQVSRIITSRKTGEWCQYPYPNHPKGCPNYGRDGCPPKTLFISEIVDLRRPVYLAFSEFNLERHVSNMRLKHPTWSERQLRNVLYWQGTSRKQMRQRARIARLYGCGDIVLTCPEAHGVNVYATCFCSGLKLQKIERLTICRHIALVGYRNRPGTKSCDQKISK